MAGVLRATVPLAVLVVLACAAAQPEAEVDDFAADPALDAEAQGLLDAIAPNVSAGAPTASSRITARTLPHTPAARPSCVPQRSGTPTHRHKKKNRSHPRVFHGVPPEHADARRKPLAARAPGRFLPAQPAAQLLDRQRGARALVRPVGFHARYTGAPRVRSCSRRGRADPPFSLL